MSRKYHTDSANSGKCLSVEFQESGNPGENVATIELRTVNPAASEDAKLLVGESKRDFLKVYAPENSFALTADSLGKGNLAFLVGYVGEEPVACGGIFELEPGCAEIKSMYVRPEARGRGHSRTLLAALEETARALGLRRLRLETGDKQHVALALYQSAGYIRIPRFGPYQTSATSICMEKRI